MFKKLFKAEKKVPQNTNPYPEGATPKDMEELGKRYLEKNDFFPGQLVQWKKRMKYCKVPEYGHPAVVLEVKPEHRSPNDNSRLDSNTYQPEEVRIGVILNGYFSGIWVDGNRLESFVPNVNPGSCNNRPTKRRHSAD